jgi:uncharacterized protein YaiL (DUF2058 family)
MSLSLREQLLKAGLVTEKQAKKAERQTSQQQHQRKKGSLPDPTPEQQAVARKAQAAKFARDQALNRERQEKAAAKARRAGLRQFIDQHRVPRVDSDDYYNFVDEQRIRRIAVTPELRAWILRGDLLIARCSDQYDLVTAEVAERIRERDPAALITLPPDSVKSEPAPIDDPYKDYVVPDDLIW